MLHRRTCDKRQSSGSRGRAGCVRRLRRLRGRQPRTRRRLGALGCANTLHIQTQYVQDRNLKAPG